MPDISKIRLPGDETEYTLKDLGFRNGLFVKRWKVKDGGTSLTVNYASGELDISQAGKTARCVVGFESGRSMVVPFLLEVDIVSQKLHWGFTATMNDSTGISFVNAAAIWVDVLYIG